MCEICKIKNGYCDLLVTKDADMKIGNTKIGELNLEVFIDSKDDGIWTLEPTVFFGDDVIADVELPIKFCPFCGRKLHDKEETKYPWNKEEA